MSINPYVLELHAKQRQEELLALARPQRLPLPLGRREPLGRRLRRWAARLMIGIGLRLESGGSGPACLRQGGAGRGGGPMPGRLCSCPGRGGFPQCPPLASG